MGVISSSFISTINALWLNKYTNIGWSVHGPTKKATHIQLFINPCRNKL